MKKIIILYLLFTLVSCEREPMVLESEPTPIINLPEELVIGSVLGVVEDAEGPVEAATVVYKGHSTSTDVDGVFRFSNINLDENGTFIKVNKTGYFEGYRTFYALENETSQIKIQLLPKTHIISIQTANGGRVEIGDAYVDLPSGIYKGMDNDYNGSIDAYGQWLNPAVEGTYYAIPGNTGISETGELKVLSSFGMLALTLEDKNEEVLDLPNGETASINLPIPASLEEYAPETIPLSYFDESSGLWIQEGTAEKTNDNFYTAEVNHFSFWNCSIAFEEVEISAVVTIDGLPAANNQIKIIDENTGYQAYGYTTHNGQFSARVPKGQELKLQIVSNCLNRPLEHLLPAIDSDISNLDNLEIPLVSEGGEINLQGTVANCNNSLPFNGYARVLLDDQNYMIKTDSEGRYSKKLNSCSGENVFVQGIDLDNSMISDIGQERTQGIVSMDVLVACDPVPSGYTIQYPEMTWQTALENNADHQWVVRTISGSNELTIINTSIVIDTTIYMSGAFYYKKGNEEASYLLKFETQGFTVSGTCDIEIKENGDFVSYRFHSKGTDIDVVSAAQFHDDIDFVDFDLVYYD